MSREHRDEWIQRVVISPIELRDNSDGLPDIGGLAAPFYDPANKNTEFTLWRGAVERIMPTAFDVSLKSGVDDIYSTFNHNDDEVLGRQSASTLSLEITNRGLEYRIKAKDTPRYRTLVVDIERGDVPGSSFSFSIRAGGALWTEEEEGDDVREVRELHSVRLYELGPVTNPAYSATDTGFRSKQLTQEARDSWRAWKAETRAKNLALQRAYVQSLPLL